MFLILIIQMAHCETSSREKKPKKTTKQTNLCDLHHCCSGRARAAACALPCHGERSLSHQMDRTLTGSEKFMAERVSVWLQPGSQSREVLSPGSVQNATNRSGHQCTLNSAPLWTRSPSPSSFQLPACAPWAPPPEGRRQRAKILS